MATIPITATNLANFIPTILSKKVQMEIEKKLVCAALCDRTWESEAKNGGSTVDVDIVSEISANAVNTEADITTYDTLQNKVSISLDQKYDIAVAVDDIMKLQTNPKYFDKVSGKLSYGMAKVIDTSITGLFNAFTQAVGTEGSPLTEDVILQAYEYLNSADAPETDRAWVFDPESITDLMKLDMFVKADYVGDNPWKTGFIKREILGSPVFITTNLEAINTNYHGAAYFQKEAIALCMQMQPKFRVDRWWQRHSDVISGLAVWGVKEMRDTFGVWIKTRS